MVPVSIGHADGVFVHDLDGSEQHLSHRRRLGRTPACAAASLAGMRIAVLDRGVRAGRGVFIDRRRRSVRSTDALTTVQTHVDARRDRTAPRPPTPSRPRAAGAGRADRRRHRLDRGGHSPPTRRPSHRHARRRDHTDLGDDVAFTGTVGNAELHDRHQVDGALACLVELTDPPPQPPDVEASGRAAGSTSTARASTSAQRTAIRAVRRRHRPELPSGQSLAFGDYRCRADQVGLYCVNYAHQTAVRFSAAGMRRSAACARPRRRPTSAGQVQLLTRHRALRNASWPQTAAARPRRTSTPPPGAGNRTG